ncbi:LacI family DNA-binding transcriptional regulator [Streptomonospora wellingtoniae]|uniref:LacI family DNA-binding transcriptional regulator n=1 Tax=Streptomonospora wellingtoniae TaxID=3075544 RepID=A0ABU2KWC2_9ACTN|nr:LacI family DNA-binding transcriptional regulator [Streptomonospora sp. DSM 45055]MDT0303472.1 LacI family DNA-binding transcriptional regulator [Streptomonospora sp. DSM 45055]
MATIKDVAQAAGVAPSTVSYVLSGSRKISAETRAAVQAAVDELGYHPNAGARSLRSTRTDVLALALPLSGTGYLPVGGRFMYGLSEAAGKHGYLVLLVTPPGSGDAGAGLERAARSRFADAAVLMGVEMEDPRVAAMRALDFPVALIGHPADESAAPWTDLDWEESALASVRALRDAGHRRVLYLATVEEDVGTGRTYSVRGIRGAARAAAELAAHVDVCHSSGDPAELYRRLDARFDSADPPTALAVQHPAAIPGILRHLAARGVQVPRDVSLVAVGSFPEDLGGLDVTRIELPVAEMSAAVTRLAAEAVEAAGDPGRAGGDSAPHRLIPPRMIRGSTVAPAP